MQDELISIRLDKLEQLFKAHLTQSTLQDAESHAAWTAFRRDVIASAVVRVDDGRGHPEPRY